MTTTDNPATALHDILAQLVGSTSSINDIWQGMLGADPGSAEFAQRHGEVIGLWRQVYDLLFALPPGDREREQYLRYMPQYYDALVYREAWGNRGSATGNMMVVDHLTGIASTLRYRGLATPRVGEDAITRLRESIEEWHSILDEADFDEKFATELRAQVDHLAWLLDHTQLLGTRPIVEASKKLVGTGLAAMGTKPSWAKRIGKVLAPALLVLTLFHAGVDDAVGILEGVADMKDAVVEILSPQKQIEGPSDPIELEGPPRAGESAPESREPTDSHGEIVDAEVVDDEEGK